MNSSKLDVIGVGALNLDNLYFVRKISKTGEEAIKYFVRAPGGSAANTIVGLSRLGMQTGFIGRVGSDDAGNFISKELEKEGVDTRGIKKLDGTTGLVIGLVNEKGERVLYVHPGVNDSLTIGENEIEYAKEAKFLHLSSFVGEKSYLSQKKLLEKLDVNISFSPGMLYAKKKLRSLELLIGKSTVVFLNKEEAELLTGNRYDKAPSELIAMGAEVVAMTLGNKGCLVTQRGKSYRIKASPTKVVDTTGAGDAFAAGFLYGLLKGKKMEICGKIGNWSASKCIEKVGARAGLPYERDLRAVKSDIEL
jgi:ribokinase